MASHDLSKSLTLFRSVKRLFNILLPKQIIGFLLCKVWYLLVYPPPPILSYCLSGWVALFLKKYCKIRMIKFVFISIKSYRHYFFLGFVYKVVSLSLLFNSFFLALKNKMSSVWILFSTYRSYYIYVTKLLYFIHFCKSVLCFEKENFLIYVLKRGGET